MDGRRLQELRDVYTKLSHQSTGPSAPLTAAGSGLDQGRRSALETPTAAAAAAAAEAEAPSPPEASAAAAAAAAAATVATAAAAAASTVAATAAATATVDASGRYSSSQRVSGEVKTAGDAAHESSFTRTPKVEDGRSCHGSAGGEPLPMSSLATAAAIASAGSSSALLTSSPRGPVSRSFSRINTDNNTDNNNNNNNNNNNSSNNNNIANITKTLQKNALLEQQTLNALMAGRPLGGGSTSLRSTRAELKREMSAATEELERGLGFDRSAKRRRKTKHVERNSFYPSSYFEWTEELMAKNLSERATGSFAAAIFELGLKHSSPKVLMKLMPPKAERLRLTTEHIKSRLQKYRLHAHRSKDEFSEFFNLRLKDKYREFLKKEAWRNSPNQQGSGSQDDAEYDSGGGEDGGGGAASTASGGEGSAAGDPVPKAGLEIKVDGELMGDIHALGAQCVREQVHLQEIMRCHISAQLKLQAEIHEHLTTASGDTAAAAAAPTGGASEGVADARPRSGSDAGAAPRG